jgi:hypothetical protein
MVEFLQVHELPSAEEVPFELGTFVALQLSTQLLLDETQEYFDLHRHSLMLTLTRTLLAT